MKFLSSNKKINLDSCSKKKIEFEGDLRLGYLNFNSLNYFEFYILLIIYLLYYFFFYRLFWLHCLCIVLIIYILLQFLYWIFIM